MMLYLHTSALVKAYVMEASSEDVLSAMKKSDIVASHILHFQE